MHWTQIIVTAFVTAAVIGPGMYSLGAVMAANRFTPKPVRCRGWDDDSEWQLADADSYPTAEEVEALHH